MMRLLAYLLTTAVAFTPLNAEAKCKKKKETVTKHHYTAPAYSPKDDTQTRLSALEAKFKKLDNETLKVDKKDLAEGKVPKPFVSSGSPKTALTLSGQINRLAAYRDNGKISRVEHLDSTASSTRVKVAGTSQINPKLTVQGVIETELTDGVQSYSTGANIGHAPIGYDFGDTSPIIRNRRLEAVFAHDKFGTFYIGKGHTSSDGVSEVDFSGTNAVSNASEGPRNLGGFTFYNKTTQTYVGQRSAFDAMNNMDGLQRANRVRYDTPSMGGVVLGVTHTNGEQTDQSIKYAAKFGKTKVGAAFAHAFQPEAYVTVNNVTQSRRSHIYNGSFAIYNSGFSFGAAAGLQNYRLKTNPLAAKRKNSKFWFAKIGYQSKLINCGVTAFALDFGYFKADTQLETNFFIANREKAKSPGLTIVQNFDVAAAEVYFVARQYHFEQPFNSYKNAYVIAVGTRVKF